MGHPFVIFIGGLVIVLVGAEMLLRGATRVASALHISPIVIGLTVVSVGTSTPELAVGITAASIGKGALAVGNIAGTNIVNILFILGLSALMKPLPIRLSTVKLDVPVMIASALALLLMSADGVLSRGEGAAMLMGALLYTVLVVRVSRSQDASTRREFAQEFAPSSSTRWGGRGTHLLVNMLLLLIGMAVTVLGADLLVAGAVDIAKAHGVSDAFIGLTVVAIGTSAPELATTVMATLRDDREVAIGNLIGSSIYNILAILGITVLVAPGIDVGRHVLSVDLPLAALVAIVCLPVFKSDRRVSRVEGGVFVLAYFSYLAALLFFRT